MKEGGASNENTSLWLSAAVLLGSYLFGYNLHSFLHELGHAVSIWV